VSLYYPICLDRISATLTPPINRYFLGLLLREGWTPCAISPEAIATTIPVDDSTGSFVAVEVEE